VTRHVIGTDRKPKLHISKDSHNFKKIHLSFIGVNLREIGKASANITHMNLMYLSPATQVFDNRRTRAGEITASRSVERDCTKFSP